MTRKPGLSTLTAAALLALGMALAPPPAEAAQTISGQGVLVSSPFFSESNWEILVKVLNAGRRPVQVEVQFRNAADLSILGSQKVTVAPGSTAYPDSFFAPAETPVVVTLRYRTTGSTLLLPSVQVLDPSGNTQIFTDGFESGDLAR